MSKVMHRIWMGSPMPTRYQDYGDMWRDLNPDWTLHDWDEERIMDHEWWNTEVLQDLYNKSQKSGADKIAYYTQVADVVDYELIHTYGGWYFNTDLKPLKPLSVLNQDLGQAAFAMEDDVHAVNMAMYAPVAHPLFAAIMDNLPKRYFGMPGAYMNATTGVQLIMQTLGEANWDVKLYHRDVFNPVHWSQFSYGERPNIEDMEFGPETVAVHEWLHRTNQRGQRVLED